MKTDLSIILKTLDTFSMDSAVRSILHDIKRPNRTAILYTKLVKDQKEIDESHRQRLMWIKDQLVTLMPHLDYTCANLDFDTLSQAQDSVGLLNNVAFDIKNMISILKHFLTWELQLTEDMHQMGILPQEVPEIVSCFDNIRKLNRDFSEKVSSSEYRNSTSLDTKRREAIAHEALVINKMSPMVRVLSLKMSDVSSTVLQGFSSPSDIITAPETRKACFKCLKKSLIVKARESISNGEKFDIKAYLA